MNNFLTKLTFFLLPALYPIHSLISYFYRINHPYLISAFIIKEIKFLFKGFYYFHQYYYVKFFLTIQDILYFQRIIINYYLLIVAF